MTLSSRYALSRRVARAYMRAHLPYHARTRVASWGDLKTLGDEEPRVAEALFSALSGVEGVVWRDGAFRYSSRRPVQASSQAAQFELMKFLSRETSRLGVAEHVYVVGGAVRNFVIERPIKDIDVVIDSVRAGMDSDELARRLQDRIPARTSLATNQYGVAILTVKGDWVLEGEDLSGEVIEIANARTESYGGGGGKGYKPSEVEPATIEEDMARREFTFNTLLWQMSQLANGPDKAEILDLTGCGLDDLKSGLMRCPSDPDKTFKDDPTRMLRAVKFLVKYGFKITPEVERAIKRNAQAMRKAPSEAIASILIDSILAQSQSKRVLAVLDSLGLLDVIADMVREDKSFQATLNNYLSRDGRVLFLLDMMDLGVPISARVGFLSKPQQKRLRQVALGIGEGEPERFVDMLRQPGKVVDTPRLIRGLGLKGAEIGQLMGVLRDLLLKHPELRNQPRRLEDMALRVGV